MATAGNPADLDFSDLTGEAHGGIGGDGEEHSAAHNEGTCMGRLGEKLALHVQTQTQPKMLSFLAS